MLILHQILWIITPVNLAKASAGSSTHLDRWTSLSIGNRQVLEPIYLIIQRIAIWQQAIQIYSSLKMAGPRIRMTRWSRHISNRGHKVQIIIQARREMRWASTLQPTELGNTIKAASQCQESKHSQVIPALPTPWLVQVRYQPWIKLLKMALQANKGLLNPKQNNNIFKVKEQAMPPTNQNSLIKV